MPLWPLPCWPSANAQTHTPSNAAIALMYAPLSLEKDRGTMMSSSLVAMAVLMVTSTMAAVAPTTLMAMLTTLFVKQLNNYFI
jgi:hypothetical protein